jgi:hypothetical protein
MNSPKTVPLATIGYEGAPLGEVLGRLNDAGISLLIDVRAVAASRRAGFSKTILASSLNEVGIDYLHLRNLGTPKDGRIAARAGRTKQMRAGVDGLSTQRLNDALASGHLRGESHEHTSTHRHGHRQVGVSAPRR